MDNFDNRNHWHWWEWIIIVIVMLVGLGIIYTWINNTMGDRNNQSVTNGVEQTVQHPIKSTQNAVDDIVR